MKRVSNLLLLIFWCSSCAPIYYTPKSQNVTLFTGPKQLQSQVGFGFSERTKQIDLGISYSVAQYIGFTANVHAIGATEEGWLHVVETKGIAGGVGIIGYYPFARRGVFETTVGFDGGNLENFHPDLPKDWISYHSFYLQPAIGYRSDQFEVAFSLKLNQHTFNNLDYDKQDNPYFTTLYPSQPGYLFIEPAITFRVGGKNTRFQLQVVQSNQSQGPRFVRESFLVTLGASIRLNFKEDQE